MANVLKNKFWRTKPSSIHNLSTLKHLRTILIWTSVQLIWTEKKKEQPLFEHILITWLSQDLQTFQLEEWGHLSAALLVEISLQRHWKDNPQRSCDDPPNEALWHGWRFSRWLKCVIGSLASRGPKISQDFPTYPYGISMKDRTTRFHDVQLRSSAKTCNNQTHHIHHY